MVSGESSEIKRLKRKLSIELLWIYILSLLKRGPSHAYALRSKIKEEFGFLPGNVSAYVVLYKLKNRSFVSVKEDGNRAVYSITQKGKALLKEARQELQRLERLLGS